MNFAQVQQQINDLPRTFLRQGAPFTQLQDALADGLSAYTDGADAVTQMLSFSSAFGGWLDLWGTLFSVPRMSGESDSIYQPRIRATVTAWVGTVPALIAWTVIIIGIAGQILENLPKVGYQIILPSSTFPSQAALFYATLNRIRPAGVPFTVGQASDGLYTDTMNVTDGTSPPGTYLNSGAAGNVPPIGPSTNNAIPQIPTYYLTDPTINPVFAV